MSKLCIEDETIENMDFIAIPFTSKEYEGCKFLHCSFAKADLSNFRFVECSFTDCDWSNAKLLTTTLNDIRFVDCKLLGLHFESCSDFLFSVSFQNCTLNFSSFYQRQLKKTVFKNSVLQEVDFTDADLTGSVFDTCDLGKAVFDNTILEKVDFRTAYNYAIDPERNKLKKAKFDRIGLAGLLGKYDIDIS